MSNDYTQEELKEMNASGQEAKNRERLARRQNNPTPQETEEAAVEIMKRGEKIIIVENDVERDATEEEIEAIRAQAEANAAPEFRGRSLCVGPPPAKMKDAEGNVVKGPLGKDALFKRKFTPEDRNTPRDSFEDSKGKQYLQMANGQVIRR